MSEGPDEEAIVIAFDEVGRLDNGDGCQGDHVFTLRVDEAMGDGSEIEDDRQKEGGVHDDSEHSALGTQPVEQEIA